MKKYKIENICSFDASSSLANPANIGGEGVSVLQAKNLMPDGVDLVDSLLINKNSVRNKWFLQKSDVLFSAKGVFRAGFFNQEDKDVVCSASVFVLRVNRNIVLPKYLSFYLNSSRFLARLKKNSAGSSVQHISRKSFAELEVYLPSIEEQKIAVEILQNTYDLIKATEKKTDLLKTAYAKFETDLLINQTSYK